MMEAWTKDKIAAIINKYNDAVERAIVAIYRRQTQDEQRDASTRHTNGRGFRSNHASKGTYYAKWVLDGKRLTGAHLINARKIALHYTGQLAQIANEKAGIPNDVKKKRGSKNVALDLLDRIADELAESHADHEQTIREEKSKFAARESLEKSNMCLKHLHVACFCKECLT